LKTDGFSLSAATRSPMEHGHLFNLECVREDGAKLIVMKRYTNPKLMDWEVLQRKLKLSA
jgi:hypothetical protein